MTDKQIAIVTGAQQGIGRAVALALAEAGTSVVVNWLDDAAAASEIVAAARKSGVAAEAVQADIAKPAEVETLFAAADAMGGVDILVNNAAIFPRSPFLELAEAEWDAVIGVNLKGSFLCAQAAAKRMVAAGTAGCIVNIASRAAFCSSPRGAHYVASKGGVVSLTRAMALELAPHRIRVNAVAPGLTDTAQPRYGMSEEALQAAGEHVPLGGLTQPEDIAGSVVFLTTPAAARITGQVINVNGGQYLY